MCFLSHCRTSPYLLPSAGSSPGCHSSLNSCDNLQHRVCAGGSLPYATVSCQWASEAVSWATLSKSCCCVSLKAAPDAPAFPQDKALPRLSVLPGCSPWAGIAVLLSDLAGVRAGIYFHGQVPKLEESWWSSKKRGCGRLQSQAPWQGLSPCRGSVHHLSVLCSLPWLWCGGIASTTQNAQEGSAGRGWVPVSFCLNFGRGFGHDCPWFNCSDNHLFTLSLHRAFVQAKQTYVLCHCHGVSKVAGTAFPTLPFIVKNYSGETGRGYLPVVLSCLDLLSYTSALHIQRVLSECNVIFFFLWLLFN